MKIRPEQLNNHLQRELAPVYIVSGDVPLLVQEAADAIRAKARTSGCSERIVMTAETGFDWSSLLQASSGMSLFSERRLIELRLPTGKPGAEGSKALQAYTEPLSPDNVLLIVSAKLDAATQRSKWFKALESSGVAIQVWPLDRRQLPAWIAHRMQEKGLHPSRDAVEILSDRVEGNLLAAAQEIEKLHMIYGESAIDADGVLGAVADSARFDVFGLVDSALAGDAARVARILDGLSSEGVEPVLVLWALAREIRTLASMSHALEHNSSLDQVLSQHRVWDKRKAIVGEGLKRHNARRWRILLRRAGSIDRIIKGVEAGNVWDELLQLGLMMTGTKVLRKAG